MKKIFLSTCAIFVFMTISGHAYSQNWTVYQKNSTKTPKAACLEMICPNGCAENTNGRGECCPTPQEGESCKNDIYDEKGCLIKRKKVCPANYSCQPDGSCVYNMCPEGRTAIGNNCCLTPNVYTDVNGEQKCCDTAVVTLADGSKACQSDETCNPLYIGTEYIGTTPEIRNKIGNNDDYTRDSYGLYKIRYNKTITPLKDITLTFDIMGIIDTSLPVWNTSYTPQKVFIKEVGGDTILNKQGFGDFDKQNNFRYGPSGNTRLTELHMMNHQTVKLYAGRTYQIDIDIQNLCEHCLVDTQCALQ